MKLSDSSTSIEKRAGFGATDSFRKMIVLISMIIIGIILIAYRANHEYWSDQFSTYNQILFGISALLLILIIIISILDLKNVVRFELLGTIVFFIGALLLLLVPAASYLDISGITES